MPKENYASLTVPLDLYDRISRAIGASGEGPRSRSQAIADAWNVYERESGKDGARVIQIGDKLIGPGQPHFLIAEIGINHNGSVETAKKMIDMVADAGWDAVKFQKRTIEIVYNEAELAKPRDSPFGTTNGDQKRGLEFGKEEYKEIDAYCKEKGIMWFASPWDEPSVDFLEEFNTPCYKIASASLTDRELLEKIKATGKPIILSTGMSNLDQVKSAVKILGEDNLILMHCTSTYPTPDNELHLRAIPKLKRHFNCPIGFSGHHQSIHPSIAAATIGACAIEAHVTLDRAMYGSDQSASIESLGVKKIGDVVRLIPVFFGVEEVLINESELPIIEKLRRVDTI